MKEIPSTPYEYEESQQATLENLAKRVAELRSTGVLTPQVLHTLRKYFRIKNVYHSNAIEGNVLSIGETKLVVEQGMTLTGAPLKDQAEAKNLAEATDYLEDLIAHPDAPITAGDIRQIHHLVLKGLDDKNAGVYRQVQVEISGSDFKPPGPESIPAQMEEFCAWLRDSSVPGTDFASVKGILAAAVGHTWFVTIHPFVDGNGRVARLLMNLILMRYGIPIAIISREDRLRYYDSLEQSQCSDLSPFVALLCECIFESLEEYEQAANEQREREEWARSIASRFTQAEKVKAENEYEVWKGAMDILRGYARQTGRMIDEQTPFGHIYFKDFGHLEYEKYVSLRLGESAKRTWFFRIDFRTGERAARYIFFFGYPSYQLRERCDVTLFISREEPPGSYFYERLDQITSPDVPTLREVGYDLKSEEFVARYEDGSVQGGKIEQIGKRFFEEAVRKQFGSA